MVYACWATQIPLQEWRTYSPSCRQPSFISGFQNYLIRRPPPHSRPHPLPKAARVRWLIKGSFYWPLSPQMRHLKSHAIFRIAVASIDNASQLSFTLYPVWLPSFAFHRYSFQELSLTNVYSLISILNSVFWGAQHTHMTGEKFEHALVFCEVYNYYCLPSAQKTKAQRG